MDIALALYLCIRAPQVPPVPNPPPPTEEPGDELPPPIDELIPDTIPDA